MGTPAKDSGTKRVLIVHMDDTKPKIWTKAFNELGYDVKYMRSTDVAMEELVPHRYQLVIFGLILPPCMYLPPDERFEPSYYHGYVMAKWVRMMYPRMPILIISRGGNDEVRQWCRNNPPALFLDWRHADAEEVKRSFREVMDQACREHERGRRR